MQTLITSLLLATTVTGTVQPLPIDWTETPTGRSRAVLQDIDQTDGALWSVGIDIEQHGELSRFHPLALRWDGETWRHTQPAIADGRLDGVLVKGTNDVWAVGSTEMTVKEPMRPVLQHWEGDSWRLMPTPAMAPEELAQFTAIAEQGDGLLIAEYGDGVSVHRYADADWQELPREGLDDLRYIDDLEVISEKEILAAGVGGVARYDGASWHKVELPVEVPENGTISVAELVVRSTDDIWAVGMRSDPDLARRPMAMHYDGTAWTEVIAPAVTGQFEDLEFVDGKTVAIGGVPWSGQPLAAELAGNEFISTTTPPGSGYLHGSAQVGTCLWAVGAADPGSRFGEPFAAVGAHRRDAGSGLPQPTCP